MILKNFHLSTNILFLMHSFLSIVIGAVVAGLVFIGSNAFTGTADIRAVLLSGLSVMVVYFTSHIGPLFTSPAAIAAGSDALAEVKAVVDAHTNAIAQLQALASPPPPQNPQAVPQFQFAYNPTSTFPLQAVQPPAH